MGVSFLLHNLYNIPVLDKNPWFLNMQPFEGKEKFLLFLWLPMFSLNMLSEELLWRGYIQSRMNGKYSWLLCSLLWIGFHAPFGIDLMIMLLPLLLIVPYSFNKTKNTTVGILIHGIYNGPIFVLVALGVIK